MTAALLTFTLAACARTYQTEPRRGGPPTHWHYEASVDAGLTTAEVQICFDGPPPHELRAGVDTAAIYLKQARWLRPGPARKLSPRGARLPLDDLPDDGCLLYSVDLARAATQPGLLARRIGDDLLASANLWLWRPQRRAHSCNATLRLSLPEGIQASLPWRRQGDTFTLESRDFRFESYTAFGTLPSQHVQRNGTRLSVFRVGPPLSLSRQQVDAWLGGAVRAVAQVTGRFPVAQAQVLLANAGPRSTPVPSGVVARGGGASVLLLVSGSASAEALRADWVAPHEFSHLLLPHVRRTQAWLPEGIATYYQEVLRARAGLQSEQDAWRHIRERLDHAATLGTGRSLADESAHMHQSHEYERVYWAGAAFALAADAQLRHDSKLRRSLDEAIDAAHFERQEARNWSAQELLQALDTGAGRPIFSELAARWLPKPFPAYRPLLDKLGVRVTAGAIELSDDAPWAAVRRSITQPRAFPAAR